MDFTGKIVDMNNSYLTGNPKVTLELNEREVAGLLYDELHNVEKLSIKIDKFREKRSNEANSYFWVLCGKLASKTKQKKIDIYRNLIRDIGDNFVIVPLKNEAVETFIKNWGVGKLGWVCDIVGDSKIEGYTNVCAYYGSSTYNSKQMHDLLESVIFECKQQGIQTETPQEIAKMLSLWGE
jgi:hypothetical protein